MRDTELEHAVRRAGGNTAPGRCAPHLEPVQVVTQHGGTHRVRSGAVACGAALCAAQYSATFTGNAIRAKEIGFT